MIKKPVSGPGDKLNVAIFATVRANYPPGSRMKLFKNGLVYVMAAALIWFGVPALPHPADQFGYVMASVFYAIIIGLLCMVVWRPKR